MKMPSLLFSLMLLGGALLLSSCAETHADPHEGHAHVAAAATFKDGHGIQLTAAASEFIDLKTAELSGETIPAAALLRTVKGDFVFVANGDWFLRTPVKVAPAPAGNLAVSEGLYEGDVIVTHGAQALWLAELQATNGGVGCADGH